MSLRWRVAHRQDKTRTCGPFLNYSFERYLKLLKWPVISNFLQILRSAGSLLHFAGLFDPVSVETIVSVHVMMLPIAFSQLISVLHASWNFFSYSRAWRKSHKNCSRDIGFRDLDGHRSFQMILISSNFFGVSIVVLAVTTHITVLLILSLRYQLGAKLRN